jgi:hypothetical protein
MSSIPSVPYQKENNYQSARTLATELKVLTHQIARMLDDGYLGVLCSSLLRILFRHF